MGNPLKTASEYHVPALRDKVVELLMTRTDGIYVDATVGGGGYLAAMAPLLSEGGQLIGVDRDAEAIAYCEKRFEGRASRMRFFQRDLAHVDEVLEAAGIPLIHGFLLDLGVSSWQIDAPERGFSYMQNGPLDMRMDQSQGMTAEQIINGYDEAALADLFYYYGEERYARRLARRVVAARLESPLTSTRALAEVIRRATPGRQAVKTLARVWQALRVEVNGELDQLRQGLEKIYPKLAPGARVAVLSYESLSDRLVKRFFRGETPDWRHEDSRFPVLSSYKFEVITRRVVRADEEEVRLNPRARSAKLRVAARLEK